MNIRYCYDLIVGETQSAILFTVKKEKERRDIYYYNRSSVEIDIRIKQIFLISSDYLPSKIDVYYSRQLNINEYTYLALPICYKLPNYSLFPVKSKC